MAELKVSLPHGKDRAGAQDSFEKAMQEAQARYGRWMGQVNWSADRASVTLSGRHHRVTLWFDEENVYAQGHVPWAFKMVEGQVRRFIQETLGRQG